MVANAIVLLVGGSETIATLLSGLVFHLLKTPQVLEKLQLEIRQAFKVPSEMTFSAEAKLPYMQACIEEALRIYPPVASTMPRFTPPPGIMIDGQFIPGNVRALHIKFWQFDETDGHLDNRWCPSPKRFNFRAQLQRPNDFCPRTLAWR